MERDKGKGKSESKGDGAMERIQDEREEQKSPPHRLHFEVQPSAAAIVTPFYTPAQQERKGIYKEML